VRQVTIVLEVTELQAHLGIRSALAVGGPAAREASAANARRAAHPRPALPHTGTPCRVPAASIRPELMLCIRARAPSALWRAQAHTGRPGARQSRRCYRCGVRVKGAQAK